MRPALKPLLKFEFCPKFNIFESVRAAPAKPLDANPMQLLLDNRAKIEEPEAAKTRGPRQGSTWLIFCGPSSYVFSSSIESFGLGIATDLNG